MARGGALGDRGRGARDRGREARPPDEETTASVGLISGGTARNVVPEWCSLEAEVRSHHPAKLADAVQEMLDAFTFAAAEECEVETRLEEVFRGASGASQPCPPGIAGARANGLRVEIRPDRWRGRCQRLQRAGFVASTSRTA